MPKREHWFAFLDDVGDPGLRGTAYFGYTVAALRTGSLPNLTEMRARLRVETSSFRESKRGSISSSGFLRNIQGAVALAAAGHLLAASVFIRKDRYSGPWLRPQSDATTRTLPADAGYLRNYLIRKR